VSVLAGLEGAVFSVAEQFPYFKFYVSDFLASSKVDLMSTRAVGAYVLLLCKSWHQNPPATIPDDDSVLARWSRLSLEDWRDVRGEVLGAWSAENGRLKQPRLREEYDQLVSERRKKSEGGKRSAEVRASKILPSILQDTSKILPTYQSQNQSQKEPRGEPPNPPKLLAGGHSHPAIRFVERDERFSAIAKAYPNRAGRAKGIAAAQEAASRILSGQDDLGDHPKPSDAAAWLLARVQQWAKSPMARRILAEENGKFMPSLASWMVDRKYADPPGAWGESGSAGTSPRAIYDRLGPAEKAECEAAGTGFTRSSDGWWSRVLGHAAKKFGGSA